MSVRLFRVLWRDTATAGGLHTCSCPACRRRECARSPPNAGLWCHSWERSARHRPGVINGRVYASHPRALSSVSHQESDPPGGGDGAVHHHLVAPLPLEEEPSGGSVRQAGLVVPHQVSADEATVVPRVQRCVEQEGVVLRSERTKTPKPGSGR